MKPRFSSIHAVLGAFSLWALALCGCSASIDTEATESSSSEVTAPVCASVSQNQTATITCPAGQVVTSVPFASFGTPTGTCGSFKTGSCNATTSMSVVSADCLGKASCSVPATTTVFGNPCSGTSKTLDIQFTCGAADAGAADAGHDASSDASHDAASDASDAGHDAASDASGPPPGAICGSVPQNSTLSLTCPAGQIIGSIPFASFGTPTGTCGSFKTGSCNATTSMSVVSADCLGKASCSVPATTTVFGNPCSGTSKTLDVQALCQPNGCTIGGTFYAAGTTSNGGCEACTPAVSTTAWTPVTNGTACSDGNACTRTDTCQAGVCTGTNPVSCTAADECHLAGTCNPATGTCPARPDGAVCTGPKRCTSYSCVSGNCNPSATQLCTVVDDSGPTYSSDCQQLHVPLPPPWGADSIGPPGSGKTWIDNGVFDADSSITPLDSYIDLGAAHIYYSTPPTADGPGVCVINSHQQSTEFDVICQGPKGKACFWAGDNGTIPQPPPVSAPLLDNDFSGAGLIVTHTDNPGDVTTGCTNCHMGENAFITHMEPPKHPLSLNQSFNSNGTVAHNALTNWIPSSWLDPVMGTNAPVHNPGPNPYVGYYPTSTSGCLSCHSEGYAGRFPTVASPYVHDSVLSYCGILEEVTNRPAFPGSAASGIPGGGMPPYPSNVCVPNDTTQPCAKLADPFVKAMIDTCDGVAVSFANSPVALDASNIPSNPGWFDYIVTDTAATFGTPTLEVAQNLYTSTWGGWEMSPDGYSQLYSRFRASIWVKNLGTSTDVAYVINDSTDGNSGHIWERTFVGDIRDVTQNAPVVAAGSPSAYVRHDGINAVVFRGSDQVIYESYWDNPTGQWYTNSLFAAVPASTPAVPATGDPIGYNRGSSSSVVYKCGVAQMCELRLVDRWYFRTIPTTVSIQPYVPMPIGGSYNGQHTIFYTGVDGVHALEDMCEPWFSCGSPTDSLVFADGAVASAAVPYNDQNGGTSVVYIADGGGGSPSFVVQLANHGAGWTASTLANADKSVETFVGDPVGYVAVAPWLNTIIFRNSAGAIYQLQWDPSSSTYVKSSIFL